MTDEKFKRIRKTNIDEIRSLRILLEYVPIKKWAEEIEILMDEYIMNKYSYNEFDIHFLVDGIVFLIDMAGEIGAAFTSRDSKIADIKKHLKGEYWGLFDRLLSGGKP